VSIIPATKFFKCSPIDICLNTAESIAGADADRNSTIKLSNKIMNADIAAIIWFDVQELANKPTERKEHPMRKIPKKDDAITDHSTLTKVLKRTGYIINMESIMKYIETTEKNFPSKICVSLMG